VQVLHSGNVSEQSKNITAKHVNVFETMVRYNMWYWHWRAGIKGTTPLPSGVQ